jgi:uncharacterized Zn finger protein
MNCPSCSQPTKVKRVYPEEGKVKERLHECNNCGCEFMSKQVACPNIKTLEVRA